MVPCGNCQTTCRLSSNVARAVRSRIHTGMRRYVGYAKARNRAAPHVGIPEVASLYSVTLDVKSEPFLHKWSLASFLLSSCVEKAGAGVGLCTRPTFSG